VRKKEVTEYEKVNNQMYLQHKGTNGGRILQYNNQQQKNHKK
jgi:hypothetical protein